MQSEDDDETARAPLAAEEDLDEDSEEVSEDQEEALEDQVDGSGEMDRGDRNRLLRCRRAIVDGLEVSVVLDFLVETGVVTAEHCQMLDNEVKVF